MQHCYARRCTTDAAARGYDVLVRMANSADAQHAVAAHAVLELHRRGEVLHVTPQVLIEFRSVATRPTAVNGLGLSATEVARQSAVFEAVFPSLEDTPAIYREWKRLVDDLGIIGKQVHDARLVAVCYAHRIAQLLTFNGSHFVSLAACAPGMTVVDPGSI